MSHAILHTHGRPEIVSPETTRPCVVAADSVSAAVLAAAVVACLLWSGGEEPLPCLGGAAAFLFLSVQQDTSRLRIPNWLTLPVLAAALAAAALDAGAAGLALAAAGAGTALAVTFVPFAVRWLGAGDVKACMVLGALWGSRNFIDVFWWMLIVGGAMALSLILMQGGLVDLLRRWLESARLTLSTGRLTYLPPASGATARAGVPFAVAMGLGASAFQLWGMP